MNLYYAKLKSLLSTLCQNIIVKDLDVNWMSPVQGKSPSVQVKELYGNLDMVTCRLLSFNPDCTNYTCQKYSQEGLPVYREKERKNNSKRCCFLPNPND